MDYRITALPEAPELRDSLAEWFHSKWGIPLEAYLESMDECLKGVSPVPQWYCVRDGERIIAGLGVIENDFHDRKDLAPNVCAVYVEKDHRGQGIARGMLEHVSADMKRRGVDTLYLVTSHTTFYERCGWRFLCTVRCDGEDKPGRMYIRET